MIFLDEIFIFVYISKFLIKLKLTLNTLWKYSYYSRSMCRHFARTHYAFDYFTSIYFIYILLVLINNLFWSDHCHLRWGGGGAIEESYVWEAVLKVHVHSFINMTLCWKALLVLHDCEYILQIKLNNYANNR